MAASMRIVVGKCQTFSRLKFGNVMTWSVLLQPNNTENNFHRCYVHNNGESDERWNKSSKRPTLLLTSLMIATCAAADNDDTEDEKKKKREAQKKDIEENLVMTLKSAKLAESRSQPEKAQEYYDDALEYLFQRSRENVLSETELLQANVYIHDAMANLAFNQTQFDSAEMLFKETLRGLLQLGYAQTDNAVVEISLKLAMIYVVQQKFDLARHGYQFCVDTQKKKVSDAEAEGGKVDEDTLALLGLILDSYGKYLLMKDKVSEALENTEAALKIAEEVFGEQHPQVAVLYNDKATMLSAMKKYDEARKCAVQSMYIARKTESEDLATVVCNLGVIDMHRNELKSARELCTQAQKLAKKLSDNEAKKAAEKCLNDVKIREKNK